MSSISRYFAAAKKIHNGKILQAQAPNMPNGSWAVFVHKKGHRMWWLKALTVLHAETLALAVIGEFPDYANGVVSIMFRHDNEWVAWLTYTDENRALTREGLTRFHAADLDKKRLLAVAAGA